ncbi:MAG: hypothetical protein RI967_2 [Planctomycetota bacterium]
MNSAEIPWRALVATVLASIAAGCGDAPVAPGTGQEAAVAPGVDARALDDAADAIETLLDAGRTREAWLVAAKLLARVPPGDAAERKAAEMAARAAFAHAELARDELPPEARAALLAEAADAAERSARAGGARGGGSDGGSGADPAAGSRDPARLRFAALLADRAGRGARADELLDLALAAAPDDIETLAVAAAASVARGDFARAESLVARHRAAAAETPAAAWSHALAAELALATGDAVRARAEAREAFARERESLEFRVLLARALRADGAADEAAVLLSALPAENRAKRAVAEQLAGALTDRGEYARAARAWREAVAGSPTEPRVRGELAIALVRAGDEAAAAAVLADLDAMRGGRAERARVDDVLRAERGAKDRAP